MSIDDAIRKTSEPGPQEPPAEPSEGQAQARSSTRPEQSRPGPAQPGQTKPEPFPAEQFQPEQFPAEQLQPEPMQDARDEAAASDDTVTRLLCAATYLRESFADAVVGDLVRPTLTAMAPLWKVDALRLVQHARRARAARRLRDRWLVAVLVCLLLTALIGFRARWTDGMSAGALAVLGLLLLVWAYVCAVALIARQYLGARQAAVAAAYGPDDTSPHVEPPLLEQALVDLNHANVVFFEADSSPFLGSGDRVHHWQLTIDLSRGLVGNGNGHGGREHKRPDPFTGAQLQEFLLRRVPDMVDPRPAAGHRLHVRGGSTAPVVDLFRSGPVSPDPIEALRLRRPVPHVPEQVVSRYLHDPNEAVRVYTFFQHSAWGGQIVVTLFVRAYVSNQTLFVEGVVHALRPLTRRFYEVRGVSQRPAVELLTALRQARVNAMSLLFTSPARVWRSLQNPLRPAELRRIDREVTGRRDLDFGARTSLRERAATYYDSIDHFPAIDERMYHQIFNRRVLECIGEFLASKNVDITEFARQQSLIVAQTVNLGGVEGALINSAGVNVGG